MAAITGTIIGGILAGAAEGGMTALTGMALGGALGSTVTSLAYMSGMDPYGLVPEVPDAPEPEPRIEKGSEGIRRGEKRRIIDKSSQRKLLATRGSRANDATLGGYMQTLGG